MRPSNDNDIQITTIDHKDLGKKTIQTRYESSPREVATMHTEELRNNFLVENLFRPEEVELVYSHYDRMVIGGVMPIHQAILLPNPDALKAEFFLERRELGIINIGGAGRVTVDSIVYKLDKMDCLYVGKGVQTIFFESLDEANPAQFFLLSAPAHVSYPTRLLPQEDAAPQQLGALETANQRTIYKYIHPDGIASCQLVMGLTVLEPGSVWNTMPPHTHDRRMEVYLYFDVQENQQIMHVMGQAQETRHIWVSNQQAVISPPWSIHAGCGTTHYAFIWGMAGENQAFTDMDFISTAELR